MACGPLLLSSIIAGVIGGIVAGALSGSSLRVSGPAAGLAVIVLNSISLLGAFDIFLLSVVIAGVMQVMLGLLKAGGSKYKFPILRAKILLIEIIL